MSEKLFTAVITGPAGSGKSTVGYVLRKQIEKCTNIDVDDIKFFIGFEVDLDSDGKKHFRFEQWGLAGESVGLLAKKFRESGFNVLITGYLNEEALKEIQKFVKLTNKILVLPEMETVIERNANRDEYVRMDSEAVKEHHDYFSSHPYFDNFMRVDSTNHTREQTAEKVKAILLDS